MALNFGGLGFEFEASDDGAEKIAENVGSAIDGLWDKLKQTAPMVGKAGRAMSTGFSKMRSVGSKALGGLALATASAIEQATDPKLSSSIDQMMAGFGKSFKSMTVGMDLTSKEAKKMQGVIGSAAYSLNEDMDGAAKSWAAFRKQNVDLTKVLGSKGTAGAIKDLIKVTAVYGIEGEQLANLMAGHIKGFNFTEERVGSLADKIVFLGKKYNIGQEAIQAWPAIFESLNQELADFGRNATPEDIEKYTTSIVGLGAGLKESLGVSGQEGIDIAKNALTTLLGERKNIINMFRGTEGSIGAFTERMIESGAGMEGAMKMLAEDPMTVMDMLSKMGQRMQQETGTMSTSFQRFSEGVSQALGPNITFAMKGGWDQVKDKMSKVSEYLASPEAKGAFTDFAKHAHSTGRSMQDQWEFMLENMRHRLMRISRPMKKEWVETMTKGFKTTIGAIEELAKEDGPAGQLTKRLLLVKDVGLSALIPELGKLAPLFGGALTALVPFMTAFGAMGLSFKSVGKMGLAGGAIFVLFKVLKEGPEAAWKSFKEMGDSFLKLADTIFPGIRKKVKDFFGDISGSPAEALGKIFKTIGKKVMDFVGSIDWKKVATTIGSGTAKVFTFLIDVITESFTSKEGEMTSGFGGVLGTVVLGAITFAKNMVLSAVKGLWSWIFDADSVGDGLKRLTGVVAGGFAALLLVSKTFRAKMATIFLGQGGLIARWGGKVATSLVAINKNWGMGFKGIVKGVKLGVKGIGNAFLGISKQMRRADKAISRHGFFGAMKLTGPMIRSGFSKATRGVRQGMAKLGAVLKKGMGRVRGAVGGVLGAGMFMGFLEGMEQVKIRSKEITAIFEDKMIPATHKAALAGEQAFTGITSTLDSVLFGLPSTLGQALGISEDDLSAFYHKMVLGFETSIFTVVEFFGRGWKWIKLAAEGAIGGIVDFFKSTKLDIQEILLSLAKKATEIFYPIGREMFYPFAWLGFELKGWMAEFVEGLLAKAPDWVKKLMGEDKVKGLEQWVAGTKKEQKEFLKGKTFEEVYDEQTSKALKHTASAFDTATQNIEKERDVMAKNAAGWLEQMEQADKSMKDLGKDIKNYAKDAEVESKETIEISKKRRAEKEREEEEEPSAEESGKSKGGKGKRGKGKTTPPTTEERLELEPWMRGYKSAPGETGQTIKADDISAIRKYLENPKPVSILIEAGKDLKGAVKISKGTPGSGMATVR